MLKGPEKLEENHTSLVWCIVLKKKIWKINEKNYKTTKRTHRHTLSSIRLPLPLYLISSAGKRTHGGGRGSFTFSPTASPSSSNLSLPPPELASKEGKALLIRLPSSAFSLFSRGRTGMADAGTGSRLRFHSRLLLLLPDRREAEQPAHLAPLSLAPPNPAAASVRPSVRPSARRPPLALPCPQSPVFPPYTWHAYGASLEAPFPP